jgi:DNA-binding MarR family transcriptional regulator
MSNAEDIPADVYHYIVERVDSVPELESLMLLYESPEQSWSVDDLARRIYASPTMAVALLAKLVEDGLCSAVGEGDAKRYQYSPQADLRPLIDRLAETYRRALIPITKLIHAKPNANLRQFADAFRIGKGK